MAPVDRVTDLAGVVLSHSGSLVASLVVWERHRAVGAVAIVGLSVRDQRVGNRLRSVARGDWGASDNAAFIDLFSASASSAHAVAFFFFFFFFFKFFFGCFFKNTDRSAHDALNTFQILEKSLRSSIYVTQRYICWKKTIIITFSVANFKCFSQKIKDSASVRILVRILSAVLVNLFKRVVFVTRIYCIKITVLINCKCDEYILTFSKLFRTDLTEFSLVNNSLAGQLSEHDVV